MRVVAVHLLNNYSGSPKVLMQLLNGWAKNDMQVHLFTCKGDGFLNDIANVTVHHYWYKFNINPLIRLLFLSISQLLLAIKLLFFLKKDDVLYVNTLLPFGAPLIGRLKGCKVIYHIHETAIQPPVLNNFLFLMVKLFADKVIYVSHFLSNFSKTNQRKEVLYNVLDKDFLNKIEINTDSFELKTVLMISSLKIYKGVVQFVALARLNKNFIFQLVVNATQDEIDDFFKDEKLPNNLKIFSTQTNVHQFYKQSSILLNLTIPRLCQETFGLTILEAMAYGLPTIVPPVGGVTELVDDEKNGYLIDSENLDELSEKLNLILSNQDIYLGMSKHAVLKSKQFNEDDFIKSSIESLKN